MLREQYPGKYLACSRLNHCDSFNHYCASLAEERKKETKKNYIVDKVTPPQCSDLPVWYSSEASSNANSLVADENTRDVIVWLIKTYDYNQSRVLSV